MVLFSWGIWINSVCLSSLVKAANYTLQHCCSQQTVKTMLITRVGVKHKDKECAFVYFTSNYKLLLRKLRLIDVIHGHCGGKKQMIPLFLSGAY